MANTKDRLVTVFAVGMRQGLGYCPHHEPNQTERGWAGAAVLRHADSDGPAVDGGAGLGQ